MSYQAATCNKHNQYLDQARVLLTDLIVILRWGGGHVLEMLLTHVHVLDGTVGRARVRVDPHPLHLLYW